MEVSNTAAQLSRLLLHSDLVSLLSESQLDGPTGEGLVPLPMNEARFQRSVGVITRKGVALPPLAQRLLELLREGGDGRRRKAR